MAVRVGKNRANGEVAALGGSSLPGDGSDWRGGIRQTVAAITPALKKAIASAIALLKQTVG